MNSGEHLYERLDAVRHLADARWVALVWEAGDGSRGQHVRGREDMVPQARERFLAQLEACLTPDGVDPDRWERFQAAWRIRHGVVESFQVFPHGRGLYAVFCDREHRSPDPLHDAREWIDLTLTSLAASMVERERSSAGWTHRQAVLESAAALSAVATEADLLRRGVDLAVRLLDADAVAYYNRETGSDAFVAAHATGPEELRSWLAQEFPLSPGQCDTPRVARLSPEPSVTAGPCVSWVSVPVHDQETVAGVLCAVRSRTPEFCELDLSTLVLYTRQLSYAMERLRLLERLQRTNRELSHTQAQLVETARLQTLGEVAARVAHDFNNVLGALLGRVQLLQHSVPDATVQTALSKMEHMIGAGVETVSRLQEAARLRTETLRENRTLVNLVREVFAEAEGSLRDQMQIHDRKIRWHTEFLPTSSEIERLHRLREPLRQLLSDLAHRALPGSTIELRTNRDGLGDRLHVALAPAAPDATSGWRWDGLPGYRNMLFAVGQLDGDCTTVTEDSGKVELCVRLGEGTGRTRARRAARGKFRVLVVDDDSDVREVLEELLRVDGHTVTSASDGAQALQCFDPGRYDIVFTDLGMPGISGWQVAEMIKRDAPRVPVVMVTGWGAQIDPVRLEASGVDRVLTKPFQWSAVLDTLNELIPASVGPPHDQPDRITPAEDASPESP